MKNVPQSQQLTIEQAISYAEKATREGNTAVAQQLYNAVLQHQPNHPVAKEGFRKLQKGLPREQAAHVESANPPQDQINALVNLYQSGQIIKTEQVCKELLQIYPQSLIVYNILGVVLRVQGKLQEAVESFDRVIQLKPDSAEAYYNRGNSLKDLGQLELAMESYDRAIQFKPDLAEAYSNRGIILQETGQSELAVENYDKAIQLNPDYAEAYSNRGRALKDLGQLELAVESYDRAIQFKPDLAEAYHNRGSALKDLGQLELAVENYKKAISIKPNLTNAYINLGIILEEQGRLEESAVTFLKAKESYSNFPESLTVLGDAIVESYQTNRVTVSGSIESYTKPLKEENFSYQLLPGKAGVFLKMHQDEIKAQSSVANTHYCLESTLQEFSKKERQGSRNNDLRILLIDPPVFKIALPGETPFPPAQGGKASGDTSKIDSDTGTTSYGLLSIAAQILKSGRKVLVYNLSTFAWPDVEKLIRYIHVDLVGITCMTHNLRGTAALSELIREVHPDAHIVVGGPHPTCLPVETLNYLKSVNTVVVGEGELTFLEIITRLETKQPIQDVAGTVWRDENNSAQRGAARERINDLDSLAAPHEYFPLNILITSRGCPFKCTFCGSFSQWGQQVKMNSVDYVLELLDKIINVHGIKTIGIKDETFTASRKRILALCQGIIERKLNFIWSCDTRVNSLDEDLLRSMRMAGCQRISLGVESGSPKILTTINKKLIPEKVIEVTHLARKYGIQVRFYMIVGNRGETLETFQESLRLIHESQPTEFLFSRLSYLPGTEEFDIYQKENNVTADIFFDDNYHVAKYGFPDNVAGATEEIINLWLNLYTKNRGFNYLTVEEFQDILGRVDNLHSAYMDMAAACLRMGQAEQAYSHVLIALEKGYPLVEVALSYLVCIAALHRDQVLLEKYEQYAMDINLPNGSVVFNNLRRFRSWADSGGEVNNRELILSVNNCFSFIHSECLQQPMAPDKFSYPGK